MEDKNIIVSRIIFLCALLIMIFSAAAFAGDVGGDVEKMLREIRQDKPVPSVPYLKKAEPMNAGCAYYRGSYHGIRVAVETHPNSNRIASILLKIPGPDRTRQILPAVTGVIGPPRSRNPKASEYGWEWPNYRTASVHYTKGTKSGQGYTIVSLFYR